MSRLLIILCLLIPSTLLGQNGITITNTDDPEGLNSWYFAQEDDPAMALPDYNDSGWIQTHPSLQPTNDSTGINFKGIGWFRIHINVDSTQANIPYALRITHYGASEIYIDGKLIKKYGVINGPDSSIYFDPNRVPLIISVDTPGNHVLAIRYANYRAKENREKYNSLLAGFRIDIRPANDFLQRENTRLALIGFITVFVIGLCIAMILIHLLLFLFHREERSNLIFSIFCIALAASFMLPYIMLYSHDPLLSLRLGVWIVVAFSMVSFSLSWLSNELFSKRKLRFYIIGAICLLPIVLSFIDLILAVFIFVIALGIATIESFTLTIIAIIRKEKGAKIIGVGILIFTLFFICAFIFIILSGGLSYDDSTPQGQITMFMSIIAILSIPVSMSVYLAKRFADITKSLNIQLAQVKDLSEKAIAQEQEKKHILENQKAQLEEEVKERTKEIVEEKKKSDDLLRNILPQEVAEELKEKGATEAKYYDHVSVLFTDFVNFTQAGERLSPQELVDELHTCFKAFDNIISKYGIEKIKTIGDAYLAVCGLPKADDNHATKTVQAALEIRDFMRARKKQFPGKAFDIRIGIHSGPVVAGIVGVKKFAYDIWGDTVNTAARMESSSEADKVNISHYTYELVQEHFDCTPRGKITAKNKGEMRMYFVEDKV